MCRKQHQSDVENLRRHDIRMTAGVLEQHGRK